MRSIYLLIICLCLSMFLQAQVSKTVDITKTSLNELTDNELESITNLTIIGQSSIFEYEDLLDTINKKMPSLAVLDLSRILIKQYERWRDFHLPPYVFKENAHLTCVIPPVEITAIGMEAFKNCNALSSVTIPSSVTSIGAHAFLGCNRLKSIFVFPIHPIEINSGVFMDVDKSTCTLYVPFGAISKYSVANHWKDFVNIVEMPAFGLSATLQYLQAEQGSKDSILVNTDIRWTVQSDQEWLHVSQISGKSNELIIITADANPLAIKRYATVTISYLDVYFQNIVICQAGIPRTITLNAGNLSKLFKADEIDLTTNLIIKGTMDMSDFFAMRIHMPLLSILDLSEVTIVAYDGEEYGKSPANEIPVSAFNSQYECSTIRIITLPKCIVSIGEFAFSSCKNLISVNIPSKVTTIGSYAFSGCSSLTSLKIPSSVTLIGEGAFNACNSLTSFTIPSSVTSIKHYTFSSCSSLASLDIPLSVTSIGNFAFTDCRGLTSVNIPSSVISIGEGGFNACSSLTSLTIPSSITSIGVVGFANCTGLKSISATSKNPIDLTSSEYVFKGIDTSACILYVPAGSKELYAEANQWKDFKNIVEMTTGIEDLQALAHFTCYPNPFTQQVIVEIQNPKHTKLTVDIYNLTGQRVKNLAIGNTFERLNLTWDGTNEIGQQVKPGIYICKINGQTKHLVYAGTKQ